MKVVATEPAVPAPGLPRAQRLSLGVRGRSGVLSRLIRHEPVVLGAVLVVLVIVGTTLAAPWLPLANPNRPNFDQRLLPPLHGGFLLGTDQLGRDLLSRIIWGARVSLLVAVLAALIASTCGSLIGLAAGFLGGRVDGVIMRVIDVMLAFPYVLLAIGLVAALGPGLFNAMIAVAVVNISFYARNIRGSVVALRERGFVEAAQAAGAGTPRILARHILPNVIPALLVLISMNVGWMITETAGLSFLGLGAQPPQADWGSMLGDGRQYMMVAYHVTVIPGAAILALVLSLNVIGDALRDVLDPRLRGR